MNAQQFAQIVLFHRKKSGMSREACARLAGVGKTVLYDIEHGKSSVQLDTFMKVLNVLNIKLQFSSPLMAVFEFEQTASK
ncbi:MAG: helix-turn-helix transcriptional regulator [Phycisphaerae bacterium]|nr:helix-turn-helix transcriptional regulator [Saprospiraceae bacterium]